MAQVSQDRGPVVWVVNKAGHDYSDAERYGELKALTLDDINPLAVDRLANHLARGIASFAKPEDYVLVSGTPIITGLTFAMWLMHFDQLQVLQWNAKSREYELQTITRNQVSNLLERHLLQQ